MFDTISGVEAENEQCFTNRLALVLKSPPNAKSPDLKPVCTSETAEHQNNELTPVI